MTEQFTLSLQWWKEMAKLEWTKTEMARNVTYSERAADPVVAQV